MTVAGTIVVLLSALALVGCGGSSNKPFCDGTHKQNGFRG